MKYVVLLCFFLTGCGGSFSFTPAGHKLLFKSSDGQFSCYTNNCCWPYKEKLMVCSEASTNDISVKAKYYFDK